MSEEKGGRTQAGRTRDRGERESQGQGDQYASTGTRRKLRVGGTQYTIGHPGAAGEGETTHFAKRKRPISISLRSRRRNSVSSRHRGNGLLHRGYTRPTSTIDQSNPLHHGLLRGCTKELFHDSFRSKWPKCMSISRFHIFQSLPCPTFGQGFVVTAMCINPMCF